MDHLEDNGSAHKLMGKIDQYWRDAVEGTDSSVRALQSLMASLRPAFRVPIFGSARLNRLDHPEYWRFVYMLAFWLAFHGIDVVTGYGPGVMQAATLGARAGAKARARYTEGGDHTPIVVGLPLIGFPQEPTQFGADIELPSTVFGLRLMAFRLMGTAAVTVWGGYGADLENGDWLQHSQQVERLIQLALEKGCPSSILSQNRSVQLGWRPPLIYGDIRWLPSVLQAQTMRRFGTISQEDIKLYHFPYSQEEIASFFQDVLLDEVSGLTDSKLDPLGWFPAHTSVEKEVERILDVVLKVREKHSAFLRANGIEPTLPKQQPDRKLVKLSDLGL